MVKKCIYKAVKHAGYAVITYSGKKPKIVLTTTSNKLAKQEAKYQTQMGKDAHILKQMGTYKIYRR